MVQELIVSHWLSNKRIAKNIKTIISRYFSSQNSVKVAGIIFRKIWDILNVFDTSIKIVFLVLEVPKGAYSKK